MHLKDITMMAAMMQSAANAAIGYGGSNASDRTKQRKREREGNVRTAWDSKYKGAYIRAKHGDLK